MEVIAIAAEEPILLWEKAEDDLFLGEEFAPMKFATVDSELVDQVVFPPTELAQGTWGEDVETLFFSEMPEETKEKIIADHKTVLRHPIYPEKIVLYKDLAQMKMMFQDSTTLKFFPAWYLLCLEDQKFRILEVSQKEPKETIKELFRAWHVTE
jgi:hypothetical protein